jgi:hypothetical protein
MSRSFLNSGTLIVIVSSDSALWLFFYQCKNNGRREKPPLHLSFYPIWITDDFHPSWDFYTPPPPHPLPLPLPPIPRQGIIKIHYNILPQNDIILSGLHMFYTSSKFTIIKFLDEYMGEKIYRIIDQKCYKK